MFNDPPPLPREILQETHEALAVDPITNIPPSPPVNASQHLSPDHYKDTKPQINATRPMAFKMPTEEFIKPPQDDDSVGDVDEEALEKKWYQDQAKETL